MNFIETTMDRMGLSSNKYRTSLAVFCTAFIILCTITYRDSIFYHLGGFSKDKLFEGKVQNKTYEGLEPSAQPHNTVAPPVPKNNSSQPTTNHIVAAEKLLDGLLASGVDEASCLSRFQTYLYRKASPHKPSSYLITKLRKYEDLHKRCGPHTTLYNKTMAELKRSINNGSYSSEICNYIVWTPVGDLGNRMASMASAFLYAVLTDRVLMVEFETDMVGLFCEPFPNSPWTLPNDFPFRNGQGNNETYTNMLKKDRENSSSQISPLVLHLNLQHAQDDLEKFFHCNNSQDLLQKVPILILTSDQYFVPSLFIAPSLNQELSKMFPEKDTVFHHLGRYLFQPSNEAWGMISRFYQAYMAKADVRIGIQIRASDRDLNSNQAIMDQVLRSTLKNKVLPELSTQESAPSQRKNQSLKSVFVASLYPYFGENLTAMYLSKPTVTGEIIGVCQENSEEYQKFHYDIHNMRDLTEIYLLSFCDVLVTSSESSFGYAAQSLGALKPWVLHKFLDKNITDSSCLRDFSIEPCFHNPPKLDCKGKPIGDSGQTFPFTKACVDFEYGMKLINDL